MLDLADVSDGHVAAGFADGRATNPNGREYTLLVVANGFDGMAPIERHRAVHHAINAELQTGEVHSMQMRCWTVAQWQRKGEPARWWPLRVTWMEKVPCAYQSHETTVAPLGPSDVDTDA